MEIDIGFRYTNLEDIHKLAIALLLVKESNETLEALTKLEMEIIQKRQQLQRLVSDLQQLTQQKEKIEKEVEEKTKQLAKLSSLIDAFNTQQNE